MLSLQASRRDAQGIVDSARTLTDNCVSLFRTLISKQPLDPELVWVVLRPVLRLLLWLVPEHVPSSETLEALARQPAMQQAASTRTQQVSGPQQRNAPAVPHPEDWRSALATAYLAAVATVSVRWLHARQVHEVPVMQPPACSGCCHASSISYELNSFHVRGAVLAAGPPRCCTLPDYDLASQ
jgi:hypothetical protein